MIEARPRSQPKPLPVLFPNPGPRPEGSGSPIGLNFYSGVLDGAVHVQGRAPEINTELFLRAIKVAGNLGRTIICRINSAGGNGASHLALATALLRHRFAVHCEIVGRCSSGSAFIALAADTRRISADGYVTLHNSRRLCSPEQWDAILALPQDAKNEINDSLADMDDASAALLMARLDVPEATARQWLAENRKWSAAEALERGFVHSVIAREEV
jgi:ATP-dependent protease ClpP protease subunit